MTTCMKGVRTDPDKNSFNKVQSALEHMHYQGGLLHLVDSVVWAVILSLQSLNSYATREMIKTSASKIACPMKDRLYLKLPPRQ